MKLGAFVSVATVLTLPLVLAASAQAVGTSGTLTSQLTSTLTSQQLILVTTVSANSNGTWHWKFVLSNPAGNTVQITSFTAAPDCDLTGATNVSDPSGWTHQLTAFSPQQDPTLEMNKIDWTSTLSAALTQNHALIFSLDLPNGADPAFRGKASASDTYGFSGITLGCPPPPVLPSGGGTTGIPVRVHGPFYLAEAYPAIVQSYPVSGATGQNQNPGTGVISPDYCFLNGTTQAPNAAADAVPGVLCLSKGLTQLPYNNPFAICDTNQGETNPRVQSVKLTKIIPGSFKCDAYGIPRVDPTTGAITPAQTLTQDVNHLRTWWTLRYTQPGTKFVLDLIVWCDTLLPNGLTESLPHDDRWVWIVVADARTLPYVIDLLHQDSLGAGANGTGPFEIPCILAEDVASNLRTMATDLTTAIGQNDQNSIFNDLIDLEAYIATNCVMVDTVVPELLYPGGLQTVQGGTLPAYQPPGNSAVLDTVFGTGRSFGILDTVENPCCCKLLVDLEFMGQQLGISFGPHTFVNGAPV